jgi:hypothetical protein
MDPRCCSFNKQLTHGQNGESRFFSPAHHGVTFFATSDFARKHCRTYRIRGSELEVFTPGGKNTQFVVSSLFLLRCIMRKKIRDSLPKGL